MEAAAATVLPHLGNMKHSPKIHIKRPTNKSNLSYRVVVAQPRELFWEAAEDKCCWSLGNTGDRSRTWTEMPSVGGARMVSCECNALSIGCKPVSVWGGAGTRHISHRTLLLRSLMEFLCQSLNRALGLSQGR